MTQTRPWTNPILLEMYAVLVTLRQNYLPWTQMWTGGSGVKSARLLLTLQAGTGSSNYNQQLAKHLEKWRRRGTVSTRVVQKIDKRLLRRQSLGHQARPSSNMTELKTLKTNQRAFRIFQVRPLT